MGGDDGRWTAYGIVYPMEEFVMMALLMVYWLDWMRISRAVMVDDLFLPEEDIVIFLF